jgi:hypothetical protein
MPPLRKIKSNKYFIKPETLQRAIDAAKRKKEAQKRRAANRARKPRT